MARDLKLGLNFGYWAGGPPLNAIEGLQEAERLGYDSCWTAEAYGSDCLTPLAWWGSHTERIKLGTALVQMSARTPAATAMAAMSMDHLSGGRFILGIGAGGDAEEHRAYGYDFVSGGVRVEQLEETLQIIKALWTEETATFAGRYYQVIDAHCEPKPDPLPLVMMGAFKPKMLRLTAKYADWWNVSSTGIEGYRRMAAECERACAEVGRDPATLRRTWGGGCICAPTQAAAEALGGDRYSTDNDDDFSFVGTPQQVIAQMRPFIDLGVDYFIVDCGGFPNLTTLELLISEVLPAVNA